MKHLGLVLLLAFVWAAPASAQTTPRMEAWLVQVTSASIGRIDYSHSTGKVAFDYPGLDGFFDVWTVNYNGTGSVCLTCNHAQLATPNKNMGQPVWNHAGTHVLFQRQNTNVGCTQFEAHPGNGGCNDLAVITADGVTATNLYAVGDHWLLHPNLSEDDTKVFFSERVAKVGPVETWNLVVCDIEFVGTPSVTNCAYYAPGAADYWYEAHSFLDGGTDKLLFSCLVDVADDDLSDVDICTYTISTATLVKLTNTDNIWDEHAHQCPDGRIIWSSSWGNADPLRLDWGVLNADGSNQQRITFYNLASHPDYLGDTVLTADNECIADGYLFGLLMTANSPTQTGLVGTWQFGVKPRSRFIN